MKLLRLTSQGTRQSIAINPLLVSSIEPLENAASGSVIYTSDYVYKVTEDYQTVSGMWDVGMERANVALKW